MMFVKDVRGESYMSTSFRKRPGSRVRLGVEFSEVQNRIDTGRTTSVLENNETGAGNVLSEILNRGKIHKLVK